MVARRVSYTALCLLLLNVVIPCLVIAQDSREDLEQRLESLQNQIASDEASLQETNALEEATTQHLQTIDRQIAIRKELLRTFQRRLRQLRIQEDSLTTSMAALEEEIGDLRKEYTSRAIHAYKHGRMNDLALILAAESINQMLIRMRYLHRFAEQRRRKLSVIRESTTALQTRQAELEASRGRTQQLLASTQSEQRNLQRDYANRQQMITRLRTQRSALEDEIKRNRIAQNRIEDLLASTAANRTPEARNAEAFRALSSSFRGNKGGFPWPVPGVLQEPYGTVVNPVLGTSTPNIGILIATQPQAEVQAIFNGTVREVDAMPDFGTFILIEHGEYTTLYSNFSMTYVAPGMEVEAGQIIGRAGTDNEPKGNGLFFGLFQNGQHTNPSDWLIKK